MIISGIIVIGFTCSGLHVRAATSRAGTSSSTVAGTRGPAHRRTCACARWASCCRARAAASTRRALGWYIGSTHNRGPCHCHCHLQCKAVFLLQNTTHLYVVHFSLKCVYCWCWEENSCVVVRALARWSPPVFATQARQPRRVHGSGAGPRGRAGGRPGDGRRSARPSGVRPARMLLRGK